MTNAEMCKESPALLQSGLNALGSDVRSSTAKIGEQAIVQDI